MTDNKISQLSALLQGIQSMSSMAETSDKAEAAFGAVLSQTAGSGYENQYSWTKQIGNASAESQNNKAVYEKEAARTSYKDTGFVKKSENNIADKLPQDAKEQIETVSAEVKEVLEDKLDISEEELAQAMEKLGITVLDLADPANVAKLVMELTGSQDGSELLLNPDFQTLMSQITETMGELAEGLQLTPEEMQQLSEQLKQMQQETVPETGTVEVSGTEAEQADQGTAEVLTAEAQSSEVVVTEAGEAQSGIPAEEAVSNDGQTGETEENQEDSLVQNQVKQTEAATEEQSGEETGKNTSNQQKSSLTETATKTEAGVKDTQQSQISYQTTTQTINNGQTVEVVQTITQSQIDVESILRQISSQMTKISVTQVQSSIEMQLNPENLGKVYLQVVSKEGAITAQIAAQNEAVKEVLESQLAVLKENMNQQGMKVEAIEVTIASHEFEQNLEENQQDASKEQQGAEKSSRRSINLNSLDELEGLMSEEESLAAKIMQENGNSVDFTA